MGLDESIRRLQSEAIRPDVGKIVLLESVVPKQQTLTESEFARTKMMGERIIRRD